MILGIGCDVLSIKRFKRVCSSAFIKRVFTPDEVQWAKGLSSTKKIDFYAKRFCAKEAISKALGCGIGRFLSWQDITVLTQESGAPIVIFSKKGKKYIQQKFRCKKFITHLSLSDDEYAMAMVVLEK